jgi:hypothetical protein
MELAEKIIGLEEMRLSCVKKGMWGFLISLGILWGGAFYCLQVGNGFVAFFFAIIGLIVGIGIRKRYRAKASNSFKDEVIPAILGQIDASLKYNRSGHISLDEFKKADIYMSPDRYSGKDLIEGYVGKTHVRFSLVDAEEEYETHSTDSDGKSTSETNYRTIFSGLFFTADFNKHFRTNALIRPHSPGFISKIFGLNVILEDPRFNKLFSVSSSNQVEVRYILTPSLIEKLIDLRERLGKFQLSFVAGRLVLAIEQPYDLFEPNLSVSFHNSAQIQKLTNNITSITSVVDELGLNIRIWTKE